MNWYDTAGQGSVHAAGTRGDDTDAMNGNAVMYDAANGLILTVGGAPSYQACASMTPPPTSYPIIESEPDRCKNPFTNLGLV